MKTFSHKPPAHPRRRDDVLAAALQQLRDGDWVRLEGAPELEADLAAFHGPSVDGREPLPWFISSGTAALEAIMLGHGIGPGDEVITTPYTWGATVSAILAIGAIPVFTDIDPISGRMDPATVPDLITEKTRAVLTVHLFGHPVDCRALRDICDQAGILLFEDASQSHGARFAGTRVGNWGDAAAFSCMGLKPLGGTEGGYALFRDRSAAEAAWLYGKHPRGLDAETATRLGDAGLLDALQLGWRNSSVSAALVQANLSYLDADNAGRRANAAHLREHLASCDMVTMPDELPQAEGVYHLMSLVYHGDDRAAFQARLGERGVDCFHYIPIPIHRLARLNPDGYQGPRVLWHDHLRAAGVDYRTISLPGAEQRSRTTVELGWNWTDDDPAAMAALAAAIIDAV